MAGVVVLVVVVLKAEGISVFISTVDISNILYIDLQPPPEEGKSGIILLQCQHGVSQDVKLLRFSLEMQTFLDHAKLQTQYCRLLYSAIWPPSFSVTKLTQHQPIPTRLKPHAHMHTQIHTDTHTDTSSVIGKKRCAGWMTYV